MASAIDDNTILVTSDAEKEDIDTKCDEILRSALENYNIKKPEQYSVYTSEETSNTSLSIDYIDQLAIGLNSNIDNLKAANALILRNVIEDSLLGRAYESITSNINTKYRLNYKKKYNEDVDEQTWADIEYLIKTFNRDINIENLIQESVGVAYLEGNYPLYLRIKDNGAVIDHYPLNIAYPSEYKVNGESVLEFDIDSLKSRLQKTYKKTKKNKAVYFDTIKNEITSNYPKEVVDAYNNGEKYIRLDSKYSGCIKVNSMGRRFGISPFFRCLKPLIILNNIESADVATSKSRSKKIIFQKLRKELMGNNLEKKGLAEQALAHESAVTALKTNLCLYTAPPFVESLEFITDKTTNSESATLLKVYTSKLMTALGIGFVDSEISTVTVASISIDQMLRTINSITKQLERILYKFYRNILEANGFDPELAPEIKILNSEVMDFQLRKEMASFVYNTLNGSLETALDYIDLDIEEEKRRRENENADGVEDIFTPRVTSYTVPSSNNENNEGGNGAQTSKGAGRPANSKNKEKQAKDKARQNAI